MRRAPTADEALPPEGWVRLGRLGRPFQLRGMLRLRAEHPDLADAAVTLAAAGAPAHLGGHGPARLRDARRVGGGVAVAFQGVYTPERARDLVHAELWCDATAVAAALGRRAPTVGADARDAAPTSALVVGAAVRLDGRPYGRVERVDPGPRDLLVIDGPDGRRWVPWGAPYVRWDGDAVAIVDPPAGLLDDA